MIMFCASCGTVNRLPESPRTGSAYQCGACGRALPMLPARGARGRYYEILELFPGASPDEVKQAYRDLVKIWHPDRFAHDPRLQQKAQDKLKEINAAYEQLQAGFEAWTVPLGERTSPPPSGSAAREPQAPESQDPLKAPWQGPRGQHPPPASRQSAAQRKLLIGSLSALVTILMLLLFGRPGHHPEPETATVPSTQSPLLTPQDPPTEENTPAVEGAAPCQRWYTLKDYERALACWQAALEHNADDAPTWSLVAGCQEQLGRSQAAVQAYQQVLRLAPDDAVTHEHLGRLYAALKQDSDAVTEFRHALALGAQSVEAYQGLGAVYNRQKRFPAAIDAYEHAIRLKADDAELYYGLGWAYMQLGNRAEALHQYERLRRVDQQKAEQLYKLITPEGQHERQRNEGQKAPPRTEVHAQPDIADSKASVPQPSPGDYFTVGSTKEEVLAVQGAPDKVFATMLRYGTSRVDFEQGRVVSWKSKEPELKAKLLPSSPTPAKSYFTLGSAKDEVLAVQGTPNEFSETLFRYGSSRVVFENGHVVGWKSKVPALKVPFDLDHHRKRAFLTLPKLRFHGAE